MRLSENIGVLLATAVLGTSLSANLIQYAHSIRSRPDMAGFEVGLQFPILRGVRLDGTPVTLNVSSPTVLYVFSPNCGWCRKNQANLSALHAQVGNRYRFVAIAQYNERAPLSYRNELDGYLAAHPFPGDVILVDPDKLDPRAAKDIRVTPQTIVVNTDGEVAESLVGALTGARKVSAETYFGAKLPGVDPSLQ